VAQGNTGGVRGGADGGAREKWLYISYTSHLAREEEMLSNKRIALKELESYEDDFTNSTLETYGE
jgi:hypothetical protein